MLALIGEHESISYFMVVTVRIRLAIFHIYFGELPSLGFGQCTRTMILNLAVCVTFKIFGMLFLQVSVNTSSL